MSEDENWIYAKDANLQIGDTYTVVKRDWSDSDLGQYQCIGHKVVVTKLHAPGRANRIIATGECSCGNHPNVRNECKITRVLRGGRTPQDNNLYRLKEEGVVRTALQVRDIDTKEGRVGQILLDGEIIWESEPDMSISTYTTLNTVFGDQ